MWQLSAGVAAFRYARSLALSHNVKSLFSVRGLVPLSSSVFVGAELSGVATSRSEYGVWAALASFAYRLQAAGVGVQAGFGLGLGHAAEILYQDLRSSSPLTWMSDVELSASWPVLQHLRWGVSLRAQRASVLGIGTALEW